MKYARIVVAIALTGVLGAGAFAQTRADERLYEEAKVLIFDKNWEAAQTKLDKLLEEFPESSLKEPALFYRAKCLGERRDRAREAFGAYEDFLKAVPPGGRNASLIEDAEVSLIDLAFELYEKGERAKLAAIEDRLRSSNKVIRYYAAFKLSYFKDKGISGRAVPVLKGIVDGERDAELRDRARIALLRVDPGALREVGDGRHEALSRILKIQVLEGGKRARHQHPLGPGRPGDPAMPDRKRSMIAERVTTWTQSIELAKTGQQLSSRSTTRDPSSGSGSNRHRRKHHEKAWQSR